MFGKPAICYHAQCFSDLANDISSPFMARRDVLRQACVLGVALACNEVPRHFLESACHLPRARISIPIGSYVPRCAIRRVSNTVICNQTVSLFNHRPTTVKHVTVCSQD